MVDAEALPGAALGLLGLLGCATSPQVGPSGEPDEQSSVLTLRSAGEEEDTEGRVVEWDPEATVELRAVAD